MGYIIRNHCLQSKPVSMLSQTANSYEEGITSLTKNETRSASGPWKAPRNFESVPSNWSSFPATGELIAVCAELTLQQIRKKEGAIGGFAREDQHPDVNQFWCTIRGETRKLLTVQAPVLLECFYPRSP